MKPFSHIFTPLKIKNTTFKNRIFAAPVTANRIAVGGAPTQEGIDTYETRARGGFSQVTLTECFVDFEYAARHEHGLDLVSPGLTTHHMESIYVLAEAIKAHGAVASIQLNHVGGVNHPDSIGGKNPIGPSAFVRSDGVHVDAMDEAMIEHVADNYANACASAKAMGFDMVMLHGGHGWLLSQFTSPLSNKRTDRWGGSLENRARFACLVLDKVRELVGDDFLIEYRVSGDERVDGGMHLLETIEFCKLIENKVDLIHVTSGIYHSHVETKAFSSMFDPHGCNLELASAIKKEVHVPVVAVGGFNDPAHIEHVLSEGLCDAVAMGRQQFADPEFVNKALTNRADEIAPCLRCSCFNPLPPDPAARPCAIPFMCTVNPTSGRELRLRWFPQPKLSKNVLIAGGGVAGLYSAITAAERGHQVTVAEEKDILGGTLWFTEFDTHKHDLWRYRNSLIVRAQRAGVQFEMNTHVDAAYIVDKHPDAVICAVGAEPLIPPIKGIEHAYFCLWVYSNSSKVGQRIVIIGGGLSGCEVALYLAEQGKQVHIIEMSHDLAIQGNDSHRRALIPRMKASENLSWSLNASVNEINTDAVKYVAEDGLEYTEFCDMTLFATGMKSRGEIVESLRDSVDWFVPVGDCVAPRLVRDATYEGMSAALDL
ncbi:MAG: NADH oxidase [Candidatus Celerinatantimonas neptuna]|nr:MAG: NADH oxidase [Candidatus Celerinatantimonas neptuna]